MNRYESARLVHGRMQPLKGKYFENMFVHYMPRSEFWYKDDFTLSYVPKINITLEVFCLYLSFIIIII